MRRRSRPRPRGERLERTGWAALVVAVSAVVCCAALPILAGVVGSLAIGAGLGTGAGVLALAALAVLVLLRARRRAACAVRAPGESAGSTP